MVPEDEAGFSVNGGKDRNGCRLAKERGSRMIATNTGGQRLTFYWIEFSDAWGILSYLTELSESNESRKVLFILLGGQRSDHLLRGN